MPKFMDHHKIPGPPPAEQVKMVQGMIKAGKADPATGMKPLQWMYNNTDAWCVTEAPNAQAVHKYHEGMGIKLGPGDVTEIKTAV